MEEYEDDFYDFDIEKEDSDYSNNSYTGFCKGLFPQRLLFNQVWIRLEEIVDAILKQEQIDKSKWDAAFLDVYQLCTAVPKPLANELHQAVDTKIINHVSAVHEQLTKCNGQQFLEYLMKQNTVILRVSVALNNAFRHLNNYISLQSKDLIMNQIIGRSEIDQESMPRYHIGTLAMCRWKEKVLVPAADTICGLLLEQFEIHRQGKQANMVDLLKAAIHCYVVVDDPIKEQESALVVYKKNAENELELYKSAFENPLKESCEKYYQIKALEWSKITDSLELIENVANLIEREKELMNELMHESTIVEAEHWAANILIADKLQNVPLDFKLRMRDDVFDSENIQKCYRVLKLIDHGLKELIDQFEEYIINVTRKRLGEQVNDPKIFVNVVAEASHYFRKTVAIVFENCPHFAEAMNKALRKIVNEPGSNIKAGDRLARYADAMLKKTKDKDAEERNQENLILVLDYLKDKEQFEKPYQSLLAIRLLGRISAGSTAEEAMISNLKSSCSADSLQRFNRMCYDIKKSSAEKSAFYATPEGKKCISKFPIDFLVLQTGAWPLHPFKEGTRFYPNEVIQAMTAFEANYTTIHTGRTLLWAPFVSTVDVELTYLDKPYVLTMTAIHYDILICFQQINEYLVDEICSKLKISLEGLKRYLKGFIDNQIFIIETKMEEINENTSIKLNLAFNRRNNRIRIGIPLTNRPLKQEIHPEVADAQNNQKHFIDCVLVRIMKAQKIVKHAELVREVISNVKDRFTPSTTVIKTCIESLIERAYMKRTAEIDEYEYIQ